VKGLASTGLVVGDLTTCAADRLRVEPAPSGILGARVDPAATNLFLRSEEVNDGYWTKTGSLGPPTVTADQVAWPFNNGTTADRVQFGATTSTQFSVILANYFSVSSLTPNTCSVYVRGVSAGGTMDVCANVGGGWSCSPCTFNNSTWTRCSHSLPGNGTSRFCEFGNDGTSNGGTARTANDVYIAGLQAEETPGASSYIQTTSATVSRAVETMVTATSPANVALSGCAAATFTPLWTGAYRQAGFLLGGTGANTRYLQIDVNLPDRASAFNGTFTLTTDAGVPYVTGSSSRIRTVWDGGTATVITPAMETTGPMDSGFPTLTAISLGSNSTTLTYAGGIYTVVQIDPTPSRCLP
jgi:hypothetical protein